jgi:hypothetical protein
VFDFAVNVGDMELRGGKKGREYLRRMLAIGETRWTETGVAFAKDAIILYRYARNDVDEEKVFGNIGETKGFGARVKATLGWVVDHTQEDQSFDSHDDIGRAFVIPYDRVSGVRVGKTYGRRSVVCVEFLGGCYRLCIHAASDARPWVEYLEGLRIESITSISNKNRKSNRKSNSNSNSTISKTVHVS